MTRGSAHDGADASAHHTQDHATPQQDGGHGKHAGHHVEQFRRRFWWSLLLTVPVVVTSEMVMDWFGYELDFRRHRVGRPDPRLGHLRLGRLAVP